MKVTTKQLYALKSEIKRTSAPIHADIYFSDTLGKPGQPFATATDIRGVTRELIIWTENPDYIAPDVSSAILAKLLKE